MAELVAALRESNADRLQARAGGKKGPPGSSGTGDRLIAAQTESVMAKLEEVVNHFRAKLAYETDAWDLRVMLRNRNDIVVVDARSEAAYLQEHIPQAISFPHATMDAASTAKLDRSSLYVTY